VVVGKETFGGRDVLLRANMLLEVKKIILKMLM